MGRSSQFSIQVYSRVYTYWLNIAEYYGFDELCDSVWDEWEAYDDELADFQQMRLNGLSYCCLNRQLFKHFDTYQLKNK